MEITRGSFALGLFVWTTLIMITAVRGQPRAQLAPCCQEGRRHHKQFGSCLNVHATRGGSTCLRTANVCCLRSAFENKCSSGELRAKNDASCSVVRLDTLGGGFEKECCECCLLAQDLVDDGKSCEPLPTFSPLCRRTFERCCKNPTSRRLAYSHSSSAQTASFSTTVLNRCYPSNDCEQLCEDYGETSIKCNCWPGYKLKSDGKTCSDINECLDDDANDCIDQTERCVNTPGNYECVPKTRSHNSCTTGFVFRDGQCVDIDECEDAVCEANTQQCINTVGSFECKCATGYNWNATSSRCVDINECMLQRDNCMNGQRCINTPGSYRCLRTLSCGTGYYLDSDTETCVDVDECALGTHNCGPTFTCRNTQGSFRCETRVCPERQILDRRTGNCTVVECQPGFAPNVQGRCEDINECGRADACRTFQQCINTPGSYFCRDQPNYCGQGFAVDGTSGSCVDVDECATSAHTCNGQQTCVNTDGGFKCTCPPGYNFNANTKQCDDIDECRFAYGGRVCPYESECRNTIGSFSCDCAIGYRQGPDGRTCTDVDECTTGQARCQQRCVNVPGSYQCTCERGFTTGVDGVTCQDVDECALWSAKGASLCMGRCINTPGSYTCECPGGYRLSNDGRTCEDIDECKQNQCQGDDRICVNTLGGYKCHQIHCPQNFVRDTQFKNLVEDGYMCRKTCDPLDLHCLANGTTTISYQYASLPTIVRLPHPVEVGRVRAESLDATPFYVRYVMDRTNSDKFFVRQDQRYGTVYLKSPIRGPTTELVRLHMNVYSRNNVMKAHNLALITVYVSGETFAFR